jgi:hypothetical protein
MGLLQRLRWSARLAALVAAFLAFAGWSAAGAQVRDTTDLTARERQIALRDSLSRPPLRPAGAFLRSFLIPGYSQSVMKRPVPMVIFSAVEATGWAMLLRSLNDLNRAKRFARDSVVADYSYDASTGLVNRHPQTGAPVISSIEPDLYSPGLITARRKHVEDWAAIVVFNHLLSAVDALVATHLWEVPVQLGLETGNGALLLSGRFRW